MGIPDEMLVDPRQVAEGLRCVICTEVFVEPVGSGHSTSCQHVFCLACITRALASKAECPLCREEMHALRLRRCQPIQSLVDEVQVRCKYFESGCGWHGPLSDRATHQAVCPVMENVTLRNQLANAQRRITSLENDKKKCENEKQAAKAKLQSKEKFLLELQKEKHQMLLQTRELNKEKNAMANRIKELQRKLSASPYSKQPNKTGEFEGLQVFVKDFGGRTRVMRINPLADVSEIHSQIAQKINIREDVFYLTCMGHILHPGFSALYYGVSRDCTLLMNGRLPSVAVVDYPDLARVH